MAPLVRIFVSYAHEDDVYRQRVELLLLRLEREFSLQCWSDRAIIAGHDWSAEIDARVRDADLILLLVSDAFLGSEYINGVEMRLALEEHRRESAQVIPIIVRDCDWTTAPFAAFQALPRNGTPVTSWPNQDEAWADVARGLRRAIEQVATPREESGRVDPGDAPRKASGTDPAEMLQFIDRLIGSQRATVGIGTAAMILLAALGLCAAVAAAAGIALLVPEETRFVQVIAGLFVASSPLILLNNQSVRRDRVAGLRLLRSQVARERQLNGFVSLATVNRFQQLWIRSLGATERVGS